jgi:hypothetical protein
MGTAVVVAVAVVAVATVFNLTLTLGLARRMRLELGTPAAGEGTVGGPAFPTAGLRIGSFGEVGVDGREITDADVSEGERLVGYFSANCPACAHVRRRLLAQGAPLPLTAFVAGSAEDPEVTELARDIAAVAEHVAIVDLDGPATLALAVEAYPTLVRLQDGIVRASGYKLDAVAPAALVVG